MEKNRCSVITVTLNNSQGLKTTLHSLSNLKEKPYEVVVIDGGSTDDTATIVDQYKNFINIKFFSERDFGIYDAMNKGKMYASGNFLHYLNAGDFVWGEPYSDIESETVMAVKILDESGKYIGYDFIKLLGYGYCHQGIIFSSNHPEYDVSYKIASDFKLICQHFPQGLKSLIMSKTGGITYLLGGVSSTRSNLGLWEIANIATKHLGPHRSLGIISLLLFKNIIPRKYRRIILSKISGGLFKRSP